MKNVLKQHQWQLIALAGLLVFLGGTLADFLPDGLRFACIIIGIIVFIVSSVMDGVPALREEITRFLFSLKNKKTRISYLRWFWNNRKGIIKKFTSGGQRAVLMWMSLVLFLISNLLIILMIIHPPLEKTIWFFIICDVFTLLVFLFL